MSHLILHIGCHKTGTSSLQASLLKNKAKLAQYNWQFTTLDKFGNSSIFIKSEDKKGQLVRSLSSEFKNVLKQFQDQNLIISGEHFSLLGKNDENIIKKIQSLTAKYFKKTTIVIYLRRQDKLALSLKQQAAKGSALGQMVSSQLCGHSNNALPELTDNLKAYLNFNQKIKIWASYFSREAIKVRLFDKDKLIDGDICADFSITVNLPFKLDSIRVNEGVTRLISLYSHLLINAGFTPKLINNVRKKVKEDPLYSKSKVVLERTAAIDFYEHFKAENYELFNWLNNGEYFSEAFEEYPLQSDYFLNESEQLLLLRTIAECSDSQSFMTDKNINDIRDCALFLEKTDLTKAYTLMKIAKKCRSSGKLINNKITEYKNLLKGN